MELRRTYFLTMLCATVGLASPCVAMASQLNLGNMKPPVNPMTQPPFVGQSDVSFSSDNAPAMKIAERAYASTLDSQRRDGQKGSLQVALVNLTNNKIASIAVKFSFPNTCKDNKCFTTILQDVDGAWRQVFAQAAGSLTIGADAGNNQANAILVDHTYIWEDYTNNYMPLLKSYVTGGESGLYTPNVSATPPLNSLMDKLIVNTPEGYNYTYFTDGSLGALYGIQVAGANDGSNGDGLQRSFFIYSQKYGIVLKTESHGLFGISNLLSNDGVSDILVYTDDGIEYWQYSGTDHKFHKIGTSYVSPVSPVPGLNE